MVRHDTRYHHERTILRITHFVNSKDGVVFAMLFALRESRRISDFVLYGNAVYQYSFFRTSWL